MISSERPEPARERNNLAHINWDDVHLSDEDLWLLLTGQPIPPQLDDDKVSPEWVAWAKETILDVSFIPAPNRRNDAGFAREDALALYLCRLMRIVDAMADRRRPVAKASVDLENLLLSAACVGGLDIDLRRLEGRDEGVDDVLRRACEAGLVQSVEAASGPTLYSLTLLGRRKADGGNIPPPYRWSVHRSIGGVGAGPVEMFQREVAELLCRIPDTWHAYRPDDLTEAEGEALKLLTAAGMADRRERWRLQIVNHPLAVEATITFTGACGGGQALDRLTAALWDDWKAAYSLWDNGEAREVGPFHCERGEPAEWRLTVEGVMARGNLTDGTGFRPVDFVMSRGLYRGRPAVAGNGELTRMQKVRTEDVTSATVNIANWTEGAEAIAKAFAVRATTIQSQAVPTVPAGHAQAAPAPAAQAPVASTASAADAGQAAGSQGDEDEAAKGESSKSKKGRKKGLTIWTKERVGEAIEKHISMPRNKQMYVVGELTQAIGRLRPLTNPAAIYVVTNEPLPGALDVTAVYAAELFPSMGPAGRRSDFRDRVRKYAAAMKELADSGAEPTNLAVCRRLGIKQSNGLRYRDLAIRVLAEGRSTSRFIPNS